MRYKKILLILACLSSAIYADNEKKVQQEIHRLQMQASRLQAQVDKLQKKLIKHKTLPKKEVSKNPKRSFHSANVSIHTPAENRDAGYYPTALVADNRVVTYIAGTPVITAPYLGDRPAFDGSDFIVNISSINRDVRMMEQRRRLYDAYRGIGYPMPPLPIVALSGKAEPLAVLNNPYNGNFLADFNLGTSELDVAAALNESVEAYIALAYDASPPSVGPRVANSAFDLNMGFVNIGNLNRSPIYFTAGQLYVPFGRYSTSMVSAPLTLSIARTKTRPFIFGYKSQVDVGPFAAVYGYTSDTTLGRNGVGGANVGYIFNFIGNRQEIGVSYISSINDAGGMQSTGSVVGTTFGGFGSLLNGNENVRKTQAMDVHANLNYGPYVLTAEWAGAIQAFRFQDLSFNNHGAKPQAVQVELDRTFVSFNRPSSVGASYQWTQEALALNLPQQRISSVYNISIWKDTVESIEYRHDIDYGVNTIANGAAAVGFYNLNTVGTGSTADTVLLQIGVYF